MKRSLAFLVLLEAAVIVVLACLLVQGREGARGNQPRAASRNEQAAPSHMGAPEAPAGEGASAPSAPAAASKDAIVWGRVTDRSGAPPRDGWVSFRPESGETRNAQIQGGAYAIAGLAPGRWTLVTGVRGWKNEERAVDLPAGASRLDFELEALTRIPVRFVTPGGAPLAAELQKKDARAVPFGGPLYAVATKGPPGRLPMTEVRHLTPFGAGEWITSFDSAEKLPKGADGVLLVGEFPVHASAVMKHIVLRTALLAGPVEELVFAIPAEEVLQGLATVRARFVDAATGAPLKGARASLNDRQSGDGGVALDDDGRAVLDWKMPGLMYLTLFANGYEAFQTYVPIRGGGELDLGTFRVAPAATVEGKVLDPEGKPVVACSILLRNLEHMATPQPLSGQYHNQTGAEGTFHVRNAGRATYLLVASAKGWATHAQVLDLRSGGATGLEIRLEAGAQVSVASKLPAERHCLLTVTGEGGVTYVSAMTPWRWPVSWRLPPGGYRLTVRDDDGVIEEIPFTVGSKPLTLEVG